MVKVLAHQNLLDIAIQEFGDPRAALDIAMANNLNITDDLTPAMELSIPLSSYTDSDNIQYYSNKKITPVTSIPLIIENTEINLYGLPYSF